jgi:hypothetical protein
MKSTLSPINAVFPLSDTKLVVLFAKPLQDAARRVRNFSSAAGLHIRAAHVDENQPTRIVLTTSNMASDEIVIDRIEAKGELKGSSPPFVHGVKSPSQLKVPHIESAFPYASKLVGVHVSVSCCTGCNGGVHDRNLVVVNHHVGGPWTGIWVQTGKTIDAPYPRWQKVLFAGGVVAEQHGATTIVDQGWMEIFKQSEEPHHAPPALPIETADLPHSQTKSLLLKGLDASWVQFNDIRVESAEQVVPSASASKTTRLHRNEISFTDRSGGRTVAYLYQPSGPTICAGQKLRMLRGFIHAEKEGVYVLLSDKEEDIVW